MDAHNERYPAYSQWSNTVGVVGVVVIMPVVFLMLLLVALILVNAQHSWWRASIPLLALIGVSAGIGYGLRELVRMEPKELVLRTRAVEWYGERVPYDTIASVRATWGGADITLDDGRVLSTGGRVLKQPERFVEALGVRVSQARAGEERPEARRQVEALQTQQA